ncbi:hypothetical protein [[Clostridium] dakarense]|uniref:hypothetical protein n=1 Tax=Faecalimicrobium dakarense TaxID=1301100 RepID=UPI0004BAF6AA|nr:hypothetical protein [[Clostridium] dakarense]
MKKITIILIICFLFSAKISLADSEIDYNTSINKIKTIGSSLDLLLDKYSAFLKNYPNYDSHETPSELDSLNKQLSVYQSYLIADLRQMIALYENTTDLKDKAKIGSLFSILVDYLITFNYLRIFSLVENKSNILSLANEYKSSADKKLNTFIENYVNSP